MNFVRFHTFLLAGTCLWAAGYQPTLSDSLTSIDPSKWNQTGTLSAGSNGLTGTGSLISTVPIPTGADYDVSMTIHTAKPGPCTGSYSLYARSTPNSTTAYVLTIDGGNAGLFKEVASSWTLLSWLPSYCADGTVMRMVVRGGSITTWSGPYTATYQDPNPIPTGQPGVGIAASGDTIGSVQIGPIGYVAPAAVTASAVESSTAPNRVDLRWPASAAAVNGANLQGYIIYRDGVYLGSPLMPSWLDLTVTPGETTTYSIYAADQHGNLSAPATVSVTVPQGLSTAVRPAAEDHVGRGEAPRNVPSGPTVDQREVGVRPNGSYWGAAGENIDLLSGNLNFSIPLIKALSRDNWGVTFALSYNSQIWRKDSGGVRLLGEDVGEGLGWTLQAGSILPVIYNGSVEYYLFSDSTGAQYLLDQNNGSNVWTSSSDGVYVFYDANTDFLHFTNGSYWNMSVVSASSEQDHGTLYPSRMEDSNGNFVTLAYSGAVGYPYWDNNSSRIWYITDSRAPGGNSSYTFTWNSDAIPHLVSISTPLGTGENYTFSMTDNNVFDPFQGHFFGDLYMLQAVSVSGLGIGHSFTYDTYYAELAGVTTPLGGTLHWTYLTYNYPTRSYRTVYERTMNSTSGLVNTAYIGMGDPVNWAVSTLVTDLGAGTQKSWSFSQNSDYTAGLATQYQEIEFDGSVLFEKDFTWTQTHMNEPGNTQPTTGAPYVSTVVSKLNPGTGGAASTQTQQAMDAYGNITQSVVSDYSGSPTGTRTYVNYYVHNGVYGYNYTPYYLYNLRGMTTMTPAGGSPITLSSIGYDGAWPCPGMVDIVAAAPNHDPAYDTTVQFRGNPSSVSGLGGTDASCTSFDTGGVPYYSQDNNGHSVNLQTNSDSNYSLPGVLTPNGNSSMQTSASYASSWSVTSMTGLNGAQATTIYDSYGRPSQSTIPDGATTTYSYTYYSQTGANTQTATVDGRWQTTTLDGFGRTVRVQKGNGSTVISTVDTDYAACACSPLGKVADVSEPYPPGYSGNYTNYTYDGSGRPTAVTAPDGASTTTYSYAGNSTTVTDPAGHWKTSTVDAYGNLIQVTEPNPAGGTYATNYTYTPVNQLSTVSMTRGSVTQTRTFVYSNLDLLTATNPENGTVTYDHDLSHHVTGRTDALGQYTQYSYDSYGRLTAVDYFPHGSGNAEDTTQKITYSYDSCTNGVGHVCGVIFGPGVSTSDMQVNYAYNYTYNGAGRVLTQTMSVGASSGSKNTQLVNFAAAYQWDTEGRMTSMQYPSVTTAAYAPWVNPTTTTLPTAAYQYDVNGRMAGMTWDSGSGPQPYANASYNPAGQLLTLGYGAGTETRTYNSMLQLISQSVPGLMNMTYSYSSSQNNGRITSAADGMTGETTNYTYDSLNRLTAASNSLWNQSYGYDGFGNLTSKSQANGSPNASPSMSISYDANNHQVGASYDANGNLSAANGWSNGYSTDNRLNNQNSNAWPYASAMFGYDPWGKRVMKRTDPDPQSLNTGSNPTWDFDFNGITGQRLVSVSCTDEGIGAPWGIPWPNCNVIGQNVYFGKKLLVSNGVNVVTDRLGTVRANTQGESFAYYPYGEERTSTVNGREKFGTYFRDAVGQDYADQRFHNVGMGRFFTVDPGGIWTASAGDPLTWNRYSYTYGDPVNFVDPNGMEACTPDPEGGADCGGEPLCDFAPWLGVCKDTGGDDQGPTGGSAAKSRPRPPICDDKILAPDIISIFSQMGKDLGVNPVFIMAVALQESGWNLPHVYETNSASNNQPLNNLFGMTYAGGNNISYPSVQASASAWEKNWGSYLSDHPTTIQGFVADLTSDPTHMYNASANWPVSIAGGTYSKPIKVGNGKAITQTKGTYQSLVDALKTCGINLH